MADTWTSACVGVCVIKPQGCCTFFSNLAMSNDMQSLHSMTHGSMKVSPDKHESESRQLLQFTDQGSSYSSGGYVQAQGANNGLHDLWVEYPTFTVECPFQLAFPNFPQNTPAPVVALKFGTPGLWDHINMDAPGATILGEGQSVSYFRAGFDLATKQDANFTLSEAATICYSLFDGVNPTVVPATGALTGAATYYYFTVRDGQNSGAGTTWATTDYGFYLAVRYFLDFFQWVPATSSSSGAYWQGVTHTPLRYLHPLALSLGTRKINFNSLKLFQNLSTNQNCAFYVAPTSLPQTSGVATYYTAPVITIPTSVGGVIFRFFSLVPGGASEREAEESWRDSEDMYYLSTVQGQQPQASLTVAQTSYSFATGIPSAEVISLYLYPATTTVSLFPTGSQSFASTCVWDSYPQTLDATYPLSQLQLLFGSQPYFKLPLARTNIFGQPNYLELFEQFKQLSPGTYVPYQSGSLLSDSTWQRAHRYNRFNISRPNEIMSNGENKSAGQNIVAQFTVNNGVSFANGTVPYLIMPIFQQLWKARLKRGEVEMASPSA